MDFWPLRFAPASHTQVNSLYWCLQSKKTNKDSLKHRVHAYSPSKWPTFRSQRQTRTALSWWFGDSFLDVRLPAAAKTIYRLVDWNSPIFDMKSSNCTKAHLPNRVLAIVLPRRYLVTSPSCKVLEKWLFFGISNIVYLEINNIADFDSLLLVAFAGSWSAFLGLLLCNSACAIVNETLFKRSVLRIREVTT